LPDSVACTENSAATRTSFYIGAILSASKFFFVGEASSLDHRGKMPLPQKKNQLN
jgi:hypothetical protein